MISANQQSNLIEILISENGRGLSRVDFSECCFLLFEDLAGFETLTELENQSIINQLWSLYVKH